MPLESHTLVVLLGSAVLAAIGALALALVRKRRSESQASAFLAGFTYVLSDDPDAAIAALSRVAQLSPATLETYFALGTLFRRKGEYDRAIRLHQNMILRPGVAPEARRQALFDLALDFKDSGMRDRAAETFEKLLAEEPSNAGALVRYRQVLEEDRNWSRAIEIQAALIRVQGRGQDVLAHLLGEAARSTVRDHPEEALPLAQKACEVCANSAHARLALGEVLLATNKRSQALQAFFSALRLEPEVAPRVLRLLGNGPTGKGELETFLEEASRTDPVSEATRLALARLLRDRGAFERASEVLHPLAAANPRMWEVRRELGELFLAQDRILELRADYADLLSSVRDPELGFACACGHRSREYDFRCPVCQQWDSIRREFPTARRVI